MSKKLINGLKYEKLAEEELHDLSQWELVDIILAYRKDLKAKKKECKELNEELYYWVNGEYCDNKCNVVKELDQLKEQLEAYNMEADEGKEINAELKAENDNLKSLIWWIHVGAEGADKATTEYYENRNTPYEENYWKRIRALQPPTYESKYKLALTEIKVLSENVYCLTNALNRDMALFAKQILQKISEVEDA